VNGSHGCRSRRDQSRVTNLVAVGWHHVVPGQVNPGMPEQPRDHHRADVGAHQVGGEGVAQGAGRDLKPGGAARLADHTIGPTGAGRHGTRTVPGAAGRGTPLPDARAKR
jgi:hypothetical protein